MCSTNCHINGAENVILPSLGMTSGPFSPHTSPRPPLTVGPRHGSQILPPLPSSLAFRHLMGDNGEGERLLSDRMEVSRAGTSSHPSELFQNILLWSLGRQQQRCLYRRRVHGQGISKKARAL